MLDAPFRGNEIGSGPSDRGIIVIRRIARPDASRKIDDNVYPPLARMRSTTSR